MKYPAITVCIYRDDSYDHEDTIYEDMRVPKAPRDDIITRHIYHFKESNRLIITTLKYFDFL